MASLFALSAVMAGASFVAAQAGPYTLTGPNTTLIYTVTADTNAVTLANKQFPWPNLPEHADSGDGPRGTQVGYNICNSTTLGSTSFCQTSWINSIDDFCLWGAPDANATVGGEEEELVAYCTTAKHGSRVIPPGALQGVQFIKTPGYVEVVGYLDQTKLNLQASDSGGEEDPHGADARGNPLGGLVYSSAFSNGSAIQQVTQWNYFIGSGIFCFKACDPGNSAAYGLCDNVYDLLGCAYNMPANYNGINGTFESCKGDNQQQVGTYTVNGQVKTFYQPAEGVDFTVPYSPVIPASSQCSNYSSPSLYTALASYYNSLSPSMSTATSSPAMTGAGTGTSMTMATASVSGGMAAQAAAAPTSSSKSSGSAKGTQASIGAFGMLLAAGFGAFFML